MTDLLEQHRIFIDFQKKKEQMQGYIYGLPYGDGVAMKLRFGTIRLDSMDLEQIREAVDLVCRRFDR